MENNMNCTVIEFETDEGSVTACLGISEERAEFFSKQIMHAFIDEDRYTAMVVKLSKFCTHPNELAFVAMSIGKLASKKEAKGLEGLSRMLGGMGS